MLAKTWLQRLTDESNLWFNAVKAEDEGNYDAAILYYIQDASRCIEQKSLVRAALSCSCAANCLTRIGAWSYARKLYSESATIYVENSEVSLSESIREALWSLQEAFENYCLADNSLLEDVRDKYITLAGRVSPFSKIAQVVKELEARRVQAIKIDIANGEKSLKDNLANEIENFLNSRQPAIDIENQFDSNRIMRSIHVDGGSRLNEKSIAS